MQMPRVGQRHSGSGPGGSKGPIFFVVGFHTNTDGSRHSYSIQEPWGQRVAFNNLCNAMHGKCRELVTKSQRQSRMALVLSAERAGWPSNQLAATRLSEDVIVMKDGRPCPLMDGEFLSPPPPCTRTT